MFNIFETNYQKNRVSSSSFDKIDEIKEAKGANAHTILVSRWFWCPVKTTIAFSLFCYITRLQIFQVLGHLSIWFKLHQNVERKFKAIAIDRCIWSTNIVLFPIFIVFLSIKRWNVGGASIMHFSVSISPITI